ncbi:flavodoxin family protein [Oceanicoccus sp. KOV_DT_Chl]|uniref:flavodoxin family protein n=1 Tax=Oceanicoccus sp. KOV_DT_Chl TaxID=1904639 RepID=UPI000C7C8B00|nr:NAD(P)H-dependent oxidoreductase [Oceanicoccus sp. KOV_DT_Chl]
MTKKLAIIYHSQSGNTRQLAAAVATGANCEKGIEIRLLRAMEASSKDLLWADGVIFGSPENLGYLSGGLKDFFDRSFYPTQAHQLNIPYAFFISAGNDGSGAARQIQVIAKGYPLKLIAEPLIMQGEASVDMLSQCKELGQAMAAGLVLGIF